MGKSVIFEGSTANPWQGPVYWVRGVLPRVACGGDGRRGQGNGRRAEGKEEGEGSASCERPKRDGGRMRRTHRPLELNCSRM